MFIVRLLSSSDLSVIRILLSQATERVFTSDADPDVSHFTLGDMLARSERPLVESGTALIRLDLFKMIRGSNGAMLRLSSEHVCISFVRDFKM